MINVVCVNWGLKFKPIYTQTLYNMVQRHLTVPHKFICYTNHIKLQKIVKGDNVEMVELMTNDIHESMKQYARNRQPFEWRVKHNYGKGL